VSSRFDPDYYAEIVKDWYWIIYAWALHEDICGFLEIELAGHPLSIPDLRNILMKRYNLQVTSGDIGSAIEDLVRRGRAKKEGELYLAEG
jgi:hypoxanthine phosphoribosyltransferase